MRAANPPAPVPQLFGVDAGVETWPRGLIDPYDGLALVSGTVHLSYFRAGRTAEVSEVHTATAARAAAGATLCRMGLYSVSAAGDLTLEAATANDPTLFAVTFTHYGAPLETPARARRGGLYAFGALVLATTTPALVRMAPLGDTLHYFPPQAFRRYGAGALVDLPETVAGDLPGNQTSGPYGLFLP